MMNAAFVGAACRDRAKLDAMLVAASRSYKNEGRA